MIKFAAEHNILLEAYSSLVYVHNSFLTSNALTEDLVSPITRYPGGPVDKPVLAAAKRLGVTPAQVILAWVRSKGVGIVT